MSSFSGPVLPAACIVKLSTINFKTEMHFSTIKHRTDKSRERLEEIISQLTKGKTILSTQAVMIRAIAMSPPFENYSYLGVGLVDRTEWHLPSTGDVFISEQAKRLLRSFDGYFPSGPARGVGTITIATIYHGECEVDLSPEALSMYAAEFDSAAEGNSAWVINSDVLTRERGPFIRSGRSRTDSPREEDFNRLCKELLDRMYELGYGEATYPVIRGDIIWEKGEITQRHLIGKSSDPGAAQSVTVPEGKLKNAQEELIACLRAMPACTNSSISITFNNKMPTKVETTGRIHGQF